MSEQQALPVLYGVLTGVAKTWFPSRDAPGMEEREAYIVVWCPACQCHHRHGWSLSADPETPQYRVAHCHDKASQFDATGYMIVPFPPSAPEFAQHAVPPGVPIRRPVRRRRSTQAAAAGRRRQRPGDNRRERAAWLKRASEERRANETKRLPPWPLSEETPAARAAAGSV